MSVKFVPFLRLCTERKARNLPKEHFKHSHSTLLGVQKCVASKMWDKDRYKSVEVSYGRQQMTP
jgi:hypothetical protein